ncbi:MAG TPA: hypothetical protein VLA97_11310 [Nocardioidaceae bacterium]|nr:hypothetical protein [Nocardioidaceae bacterium]
MSTVPPPYRQLVDDAAIFPPGNAPLSEAVAAHLRHRAAGYADLVGGFVVSDVKLPDLISEVGKAGSPGPLAVNVVVTGGAGAIEPAVRWALDEALDLRAVEVALRDEADLAHNARRMVTVVDQLRTAGTLADEVLVHVEPPPPRDAPGPGWLGALDEVAALDLRLKFRTGGASADSFPSAAALAACISAALDHELAFKCTAGLHHPVRHTDDATGFEHHGFLNVLLATRASLDGATIEETAAVLEQRDPAAVRDLVEQHGPDALASARRWFTSFGSCSVLEPLEDLVELALLPHELLENR